ncbi:MAG: efflux RND transporter permease subunit [Prevotellaceae bacterium]|jgi:multidrug efflux pump|nr:efflux RND transporter permease subunit [Prevotellaceae bacterium]
MASLPTTSINRPVLATVLNLVIMIFGLIGISYLGVREYPSVDRPIISVQTSYPGANADVIESQITEPLEQQINGIQGIRTLTSQSSQGQSRLTIEFELNIDMETAANDVRDKVSQATRFLPRDVDPPVVSKNDADATPIMSIAIQSPSRSLMDISDIAELTFKERLQTIANVSSVNIWGQQRYSMRLWLDSEKMGAAGITPNDVQQAITRENVELPSGAVEGNTIELSIRTLGLMKTPEEFNNVIIKVNGTQTIRFRDIGYAELHPENEYNYMKINGIPAVSNVIVAQPGANQIEIADEAYRRLKEIQKDIPQDIQVTILFDNTQFVRASVSEVQSTIYEALIIVIVIIFLFLRNIRTTVIPLLAIPVSLVGTFFFMYLLGFSINVLTLLAIVLSVGLVVDDAIVVVENIFVKIEQGMTPKEAGIKGANELYFAIISTTITLVSVFLPIVFMEGMTGKLFREFSLVLAVAVVISAFVALTLTPMLSTKLLKKKEKENWFYRFTEPFFVGLNNIYMRILEAFLRVRWAVWIIILASFGFIYLLFTSIPSELAPLEDRSRLNMNMIAQQGATYDYVNEFISGLSEELVDSIPEDISIMIRMSGSNGFSNIILPGMRERTRSQGEIATQVSQIVGSKSRVRTFVTQQSTFGSQRGGMPVQYVLQASNLDKLKDVLPDFMYKVSQSPILMQSDVDLKFNKPELQVEINRDKATQLGISTRDIGLTFQLALSGQRMGYFYRNGKQYQIVGKLRRNNRNAPSDIRSLYVKNNNGQMIQMANFTTFHETSAPPTLYRYNRFVAATISANLQPGHTIGEGLEEMDKIAKETLDDTFRTALSGESRDFRESASSLMFAFGLALILIFLVLAAQFESFKDPFIIMITVPLALLGALFFMWYFGQTMNIFSQIGVIMLIGLVTKNGILIVEFANQFKEKGYDKFSAIKEAAVQRLRPILMTSASTILGILPLAMATGEGAKSRIAMGISVAGGMFVATFMTLFVVPAIYSYISTRTEKITKRNDD